MLRRILVVSACALLVLAHVSESEAARRVHWGRRVRAKMSHQVASRSVVKPGAYPRIRQVDGKTLWDLGKQKGQWPQLP